MTRYSDYEDFVKAWVSSLNREVQTGRYSGCPFLSFSSQTLSNRGVFQNNLREIMQGWVMLLEDYLNRYLSGTGKQRNSPGALYAKRIILIYEGTVQTYLATGDVEYLEGLEAEFLRAIRS